MSSDAFTDLRAWLQGTANTTTEEEPFLTANPVPHQGPHASDAPEGDEDLEGLFAGFNWDLSSHGLPEPSSPEDLTLRNAAIEISPADTLLQPQPPSGQGHTRAQRHGQFVPHPLPQADHPFTVPFNYAPYGALLSATGPWVTPVDPYQAYYASRLYQCYTAHPSHVALHSVTSDSAPGRRYAGQEAVNTNYIDYANGDVVYTPAPRAPRSKRPRSGTRKDVIRLYVNRRSKPQEPAAYNYKCEHCDAWFSRSSDRRRHIRNGCANGEQKEWECPLCFKVYSRNDARGRHCRDLHGMSYKEAVALALQRTTNIYVSSEERQEPVDSETPSKINRYRTTIAGERYNDRDRVVVVGVKMCNSVITACELKYDRNA
ncbi:hypothetical protein IEO21_09890 [Rhodonia placenta]|uniref:C2H2-type domain-containing protein n=1 Tax=Rhodonia placenta TaxID=104341 RepID=A0A8H7TY19_9APHY|nr:hypothetical protein IEO21_09890 [Postia placenta]